MENLLERTEGFPNHSYIVVDGSTLIGFRPAGTIKWKKFQPGLSFSKSGRKFDKYPVPVAEGFTTNLVDISSKLVVGSNGDEYVVKNGKCSCLGFKYRGKCKHV